ncbi:MAG: 50S ribosomal protein L24 [Sorangiineae bacterium NIC37A_2]|jgi:large subunit ribosomal protein L24|nr:MAG: 50S ribosomal protein L24 [Sorangiineae bacterium NIC37A_2]
MNRLRVGDQVLVTAGNHKGKKGRLAKIDLESGRVIVEGVNLVKRHVRATSESAGGIQQKPAPIAISNVMPLDPETGKATRVRFETRDGKKVRVAKSGAIITSAES